MTIEKYLKMCETILKDNIKEFKMLSHNLRKALTEEYDESRVPSFDFCKSILNNILKTVYHIKPANKILNKNYYFELGNTVEESLKIVSNIQKTRSKRCTEYWLKRGYSESEAIKKVSEHQKANGNFTIEKLRLEYWLKQGYSESEAKKLCDDFKTRIASSSERHLIEINGIPKEKIKEVRTKYSSRDAEKVSKKYNVSIEEAQKVVSDRIARSTLKGPRNGMFGKPSPIKSGAAYSGTYKGMVFRSFSEYCFIKIHEKESIRSAEKEFKVKLPTNRTYFPDFVIGNTIIEIKADFMVENEETVLKIKTLKESFPTYNVLLIPASEVPKISKEEIIKDLDNGDLKITETKLKRFKKFIGI